MFEDACRLMHRPGDLKALTHIIGHLCRETESALRDMIRPLDPTLKKRSGGGSGSGHEVEVTALLKLLGLDGDPSATADWLSLVGKLHDMAHRKDLRAPPPPDEQFNRIWHAFNRTLSAVLLKLEHRYAGFHARIDDLLK